MSLLKLIVAIVTMVLLTWLLKRKNVRQETVVGEPWPTTVDAAVSNMLSNMTPQDKAMVKATREEDLIMFLHGWGKVIRRHYGLQSGNEKLLQSACGGPSDASGATLKIIEGVWHKLQTSEV